MLLVDEDIGGAKVLRQFNKGGQNLKAGTVLTAEEVLSIPIANRRALIDSGYLALSAKGHSKEPAERYMIQTGKGAYDVIAGHKLNKKALSREEAEDLVNRR